MCDKKNHGEFDCLFKQTVLHSGAKNSPQKVFSKDVSGLF